MIERKVDKEKIWTKKICPLVNVGFNYCRGSYCAFWVITRVIKQEGYTDENVGICTKA